MSYMLQFVILYGTIIKRAEGDTERERGKRYEQTGYDR
jgi:hypothetical protein